LLVLFASAARADSTTSGNLSFALFGDPSPTSPLPTAGSFTYNKSAKQFASFAVTWDGMTFDFTAVATQQTYLALRHSSIAKPLTWDAICIPGTVNPTVPCDDAFGFFLDFPNNVVLIGQWVSGLPTVSFAEASGTFHDPPASTPEPMTGLLLLLGSFYLWAPLKNKRSPAHASAA
jgi:hypothetical protein